MYAWGIYVAHKPGKPYKARNVIAKPEMLENDYQSWKIPALLVFWPFYQLRDVC
jgi:hypothetical protein